MKIKKLLLILLCFPMIGFGQDPLIQFPVNSNIKILYAGDYKKGELDVNILYKFAL